MRRACATVFIITMLLAPGVLMAQEELTSDQLRRMYDDAVAQMKTTQDRRNELARDSEKLRARIAELEGKLEETRAQMTAMADSTYKARAECAAFDEFLKANVSLRGQWLAFLQKSIIPATDVKQLLDADWPFSSIR